MKTYGCITLAYLIEIKLKTNKKQNWWRLFTVHKKHIRLYMYLAVVKRISLNLQQKFKFCIKKMERNIVTMRSGQTHCSVRGHFIPSWPHPRNSSCPYLFGRYNPSVRTIDNYWPNYSHHLCMLCVLILYISGGTYSLKSTPNDRIFEKLS